MRRLVLALVLVAAACGQPEAAPADDGPKSALGFTAHAGAVEFPSDTDWIPTTGGLNALVPLKSCVLGIGDYATGNRMLNANWTGAADCTSLRIGPIGGGLPGVAAVPDPDGSVLGAGAKLSHRDPGGTVTELGELRGRRDVRALARSGAGLVAVGTAFLDGRTTRPVAWVSDDGGKTERTVVMPLAEGVTGANGPSSVAAAGPELLAAGCSNPRLQLWASHDGGGSWTVSELATPSDETLVYGILPVAGQLVHSGHTRTRRCRGGRAGRARQPRAGHADDRTEPRHPASALLLGRAGAGRSGLAARRAGLRGVAGAGGDDAGRRPGHARGEPRPVAAASAVSVSNAPAAIETPRPWRISGSRGLTRISAPVAALASSL